MVKFMVFAFRELAWTLWDTLLCGDAKLHMRAWAQAIIDEP